MPCCIVEDLDGARGSAGGLCSELLEKRLRRFSWVKNTDPVISTAISCNRNVTRTILIL